MKNWKGPVAGLLLLAMTAFAGCGPTGLEHGMENQRKANPLTESDFFPDGRSSRPLVPGTVSHGHFHDDELLYTGKIHGQESNLLPFPASMAVLKRGQENFNIYCAVCHDRAGTGDGMIARRGFKHPPSFHTDDMRKAPAGHYFDVITNGFGSMYSYADRIPVEDRWAIVAYIRALQRSQHATLADVPASARAELDKEGTH